MSRTLVRDIRPPLIRLRTICICYRSNNQPAVLARARAPSNFEPGSRIGRTFELDRELRTG